MLTTDLPLSLSLSPRLSLFFSLSLKESEFMFFFTSSFHILVELNENFRYETRLEKKKVSLYVFVSKVQLFTRKTIPKPMKRKLEIIKLSKKDKQNW